jgi:hypothetical protein
MPAGDLVGRVLNPAQLLRVEHRADDRVEVAGEAVADLEQHLADVVDGAGEDLRPSTG